MTTEVELPHDRGLEKGDHQQILDVVATLEDALGSALLGAYLHGSAALGGLHGQSDIDVREPEAGPVRVEGEGRVPPRAQGAHRGREGHTRHRQDVSPRRGPDAIRQLEAGHARGKLVITV